MGFYNVVYFLCGCFFFYYIGLDVSGVLELYGYYFYFYLISCGYDWMLCIFGKDFYIFV